MTDRQSSTKKAMGDAIWGSIGQFGGILAGILAALLLPRALGAGDYGDWVLLRGLMSFVCSFSVLGTAEIMARFHVSRMAEGQIDRAAQVFKMVVVLRFLISLAAPCLFVVLAPGRVHLPGGFWDLSLLAAAVFCHGVSMTFLLLLYGHRDFIRIAIFNTLQPAAVPLLVVFAHAQKGFDAIPEAVVAGDAFVMIVVAVLALRRWHWPAGWPTREERRTIMRFGGIVGMAGLGVGAFQTMTPYLMSIKGFAAEAVGFVGLSGRLAGLISLFLATIGASLFPSLTHVYHTDGLARMIRWHDVGSRAGVLLALLSAGAVAWIGPWVIPRLFGRDFAGSVPVVVLGVLAAAPYWMGGQQSRLALLMNRPRVLMVMVVALLSAFSACLCFFPADAKGLGAARAVLVGSFAYGASGLWCLRAFWPIRPLAGRLLLPLICTLLVVSLESLLPVNSCWRVLGFLGWPLVFGGLAWWGGALTRLEAAKIIQTFFSLLKKKSASSLPDLEVKL